MIIIIVYLICTRTFLDKSVRCERCLIRVWEMSHLGSCSWFTRRRVARILLFELFKMAISPLVFSVVGRLINEVKHQHIKGAGNKHREKTNAYPFQPRAPSSSVDSWHRQTKMSGVLVLHHTIQHTHKDTSWFMC